MTKAEEMRKITDKAIEQKKAKILKNHELYVLKIMETRIRPVASVGLDFVSVKLKRKYCTNHIINSLKEKGFAVLETRMNCRSILKIKW